MTFHVGSQCTSTSSFVQALASAGRLMRQLAGDGLELEMLDIGGGFPARYGDKVPTHRPDRSRRDVRRIDEHLPYRPALIAAEPGRHLVAETAVMAATVLGREERAGEEWLYLDVGAYNGLMETHRPSVSGGPLWSSRADHGVVPHVPYTITGPTCDSADTMFYGAALPVTMAEGDASTSGRRVRTR